MNNFFDKCLHHYGKSGDKLDVLIIGAMDGVSFDESRGYIDAYNWDGLFVEPMPEMFQRLKRSFVGRPQEHKNKYEMSAITETDTTVEMIYIPHDIVDSGAVHSCFNGMSAIYPPRNGLGSEGDRLTVEKYSKRIIVNGITLETLFKTHNITNIDFISVDTEGWDWKVIRQLDFSKFRPKLIRCEYINLSEDEQTAMREFFVGNNYEIEIHGQNIDALDRTILNDVMGSKVYTGTPSSSPPQKRTQSNLTLVTALFDIGRGDLTGGFGRHFSHYLESFSKLLEVNLPMVIFCDQTTEEFVWKHRTQSNTRVIRKTTDDLKSFPFYSEVQCIRTDKNWLGQSGWLPDSTQASLEFYNPLVMSKQFFLNDASIFNFFDTKYFLWMDAGLANTVHLPSYITGKEEEFTQRITRHMNRMLYVAFPYDGMVEVHGFEKKEMNRQLGIDTPSIDICRGGVFGGTRSSIEEINGLYYGVLHDTLARGYMGTEENIFTILSYKYPNKCNVRMIEPNGLVYKFFENLEKEPYSAVAAEPLALYILTFNLPDQLNLWLDAFKKAYPKEFNTHKKYVINNSTDPKVSQKYNEIFEENDLEVIWDKGNLGINSARRLAAEHFDASGHEFMIFYEDDMLMEAARKTSKSGFATYHPTLLDDCVDIMKTENLDFLKLSFDEFFGTNEICWAWYNVPQEKKAIYFPDRPDGADCKKTKIDYIGTHKGLSFAIGGYHYCNWPLVFSKAGNKKVFLDVKWEHEYEQTLMSFAYTLWHEGKLKTGCLLLSPITHNRVHHYAAGSRRENKNYKN